MKNIFSILHHANSQLLPHIRLAALAVAGSSIVLLIAWKGILEPLGWPPLSLVLRYFAASLTSRDTYLGILATGARAVVGTAIGYLCALVLSIVTGRTLVGWALFFLLLMALQKIPAIAMVHVFVKSQLGFGFVMTVTLTSTVVLAFTWLVLHHRATTLDSKEIFALHVVGFGRTERLLYGIVPHFGAAIGSAARLAASIAVIIVVIGEWQGTWDTSSLFAYGLGILISRAELAADSEARVLAYCIWLGVLGVLADAVITGLLGAARRYFGIEFSR